MSDTHRSSCQYFFNVPDFHQSVTAYFIARSLLAVLSLLLTAPSEFFAARNQQLATRCLILAFRYLILISHTSPLAAQCFQYALLIIYLMLLTGLFGFLLSSNSLFASFNSMLFIVKRY